MKKIIAMLAFTAVLCSFASCGHDSADEVTEESSVSSVSEAEAEEKSDEEVSSESEEVSAEESEEETSSDNVSHEGVEPDGDVSFEDAINMLLESICKNDVETALKLTFPDKYIDVIKLLAEAEGEPLETLMSDMYGESENVTASLVQIVSAEPITDEYIDMMSEMYGTFELMRQYIEEKGSDNFDIEEAEEYFDETDEFPAPYFDIDIGYIVNFILEYTEDGDTDTEEVEMIMYYIDGEGWKSDLSMLGYVKKSKQASINLTAATIMKAANVACTELDEMGVELPEKCIISSDDSKNYNVSDDFVSQFEETLEPYFSDYTNYDYFIIIKGGYVVYAAAVNPDSPKFAGTYPANQLYSTDEEYVSKDDKITYDEIYDICLEQIK